MKKRMLHWLLVCGMVAGMLPPNLQTAKASQTEEPSEALSSEEEVFDAPEEVSQALTKEETVAETVEEEVLVVDGTSYVITDEPTPVAQETHSNIYGGVTFASGTGTAADPWVIATSGSTTAAGIFGKFADAVATGETFGGKYIRLDEDITYSGDPVGLDYSSGDIADVAYGQEKTFAGNFDGNYKTINYSFSKEYNSTKTPEDYNAKNHAPVGLFANIGSSGVVQNLNVAGSVTLHLEKTALSITDNYGATTTNATGADPSVKVSSEPIYVGGLAGINSGLIINCSVNMAVSGSAEVKGSVFPDPKEAQFTNATPPVLTVNKHDVHDYLNGSSIVFVGGITGLNSGRIINSSNNGAVSAEATADLDVELDSYYQAGVSNSDVWDKKSPIVSSEYYDLNNDEILGDYSQITSAEAYAGGIAGSATSVAEIVNSYNNNSTVIATSTNSNRDVVKNNSTEAGGGTPATAAENANAVLKAYANSYAGGLVGIADGTSILNSFNLAEVTALITMDSADVTNAGTLTTTDTAGDNSSKVYYYNAFSGGVVGTGTADCSTSYWLPAFENTATDYISIKPSTANKLIGSSTYERITEDYTNDKEDFVTTFTSDNSVVLDTDNMYRINDAGDYNDETDGVLKGEYLYSVLREWVDTNKYLYRTNFLSVTGKYTNTKVVTSAETGDEFNDRNLKYWTASHYAPRHEFRIDVFSSLAESSYYLPEDVSAGYDVYGTVTVNPVAWEGASGTQTVTFTIEPLSVKDENGAILYYEYDVNSVKVYSGTSIADQNLVSITPKQINESSVNHQYEFIMQADTYIIIAIDYKQMYQSDCGVHLNGEALVNSDQGKMDTLTGSTSATPTYYYLQENVSRTDAIKISGNVHVCLNNHTLDCTGDTTIFDIEENSTLSLCAGTATSPDDAPVGSGSGIIKHNTVEGTGVYVGPNGTFNLESGTITNCATAIQSEGQSVNIGITANVGTTAGNHEYIKITGNTVGVDILTGNLTMNYGTISKNETGVQISGKDSIFYLKNGSILTVEVPTNQYALNATGAEVKFYFISGTVTGMVNLNDTGEGYISTGNMITGDVTNAGYLELQAGSESSNASIVGTVKTVDLNMEGYSTISNAVTAAGSVTMDNAKILEGGLSASVTSTDNSPYALYMTNGSSIAGDVTVLGVLTGLTENEVTMVKSTIQGNLTTNGYAMLSNGSKVTGAIKATGDVSLDSSKAGTITGDNVTVTNASTVADSITATGTVDVVDSTIGGAITASKDITLTTNTPVTTETTVGGNVTSTTGAVTMTEVAVTGSVSAVGDVSMMDSAVTGDVSGANINMDMVAGGTRCKVGGNIDATGDVYISNTDVTGTIAAKGDITVSGSTVGDYLNKTSITGANLTVIGASVITGNVTIDGTVEMLGGTITGIVKAKTLILNPSTVITGAVTVDNLIVTGGEITGSTAVSVQATLTGGTISELTLNTDSNMTISGAITIPSLIYNTTNATELDGDGLTGGKITFTAVTEAMEDEIIFRPGNSSADGVGLSSMPFIYANPDYVAKLYHRVETDCIYIGDITPQFSDLAIYWNDNLVTSGYPLTFTAAYGDRKDIQVCDAADVGVENPSFFRLYYTQPDGDGKEVEVAIPTNVGTYKVYAYTQASDIFNDKAVYIGELVITPKELKQSEYDCYLVDSQLLYTGEPVYPTVVVYNRLSQKNLILGTDYELYYAPTKEPTEVGMYTVEIIGMGNYTFYEQPLKLNFEITTSTTTLDILEYDLYESQSYEYGTKLPISVKPTMTDPVTDELLTVPHKDAGKYEVKLYKIVNGEEILVLDTFSYNSVTDCYEAVYDTSAAEFNDPTARTLAIGYNDLLVKFNSVYGGNGNMTQAEAPMSITLAPAELMAIVPRDTTRVYNGNATYVVDGLDIYWKKYDASGSISTLINANDKVTAKVNGFVESADVRNNYTLFISSQTDIELYGDHADYYSLALADIDTSTNTVAITKKSVTSIDKKLTIEVIQGVGTFPTPQITYDVDGETVGMAGTLTYTDSVYNSYDSIVAYLKTVPVNTVLTVPYKFVPDNATNYDVTSFTGTITFFVVEIAFTGSTDAIKIPLNPVYGNPDNFVYDPSYFVAHVGAGTTSGAYFLTVTDSLGSAVTDLTLMKVGDYTYTVKFTSYDGTYKDIVVTTGGFTVNKRPVEYNWETLTFVYNSLVQTPVAYVTNPVWVDDIKILVTGGQKNAGSYTAQLALSGADKANYDLITNTVNFVIEPAPTQGIVNLVISDTNNDNVLNTTDVLTADLSGIYPTGGSVFYHWYRDGILTNSTWESYTLTTLDVDAEIYCIVSFSGNTAGTITSTTLTEGSRMFTGVIEISHDKGTLTATVTDAITSDYTIYWTGVNTSATGNTYTMDYADYDTSVTATVIANDTSSYTGSFTNSIEVPSSRPTTPSIEAKPGDQQVTVTWAVAFHGGAELQDFELSVRDTEGQHITGSPFSATSDLTSYTVKELENNVEYIFSIAATNSQGTAYSEEVTAIPGITDTDTEGNVTTTTTTTTTYDDENGITITETTTTDTNVSDGSYTVTVQRDTEDDEGVIFNETISTSYDAEGNVTAFSQDYYYLSDAIEIDAEVVERDGVSTGKLTTTTEVSDKVNLPVDLMRNVVERENSSLTVNTPNASMVFDNLALETLFANVDPESTGTMQVVAEYSSVNLLHTSVRERLQSAFIINLYVVIDGVELGDFGGGTAQITVPYVKADISKNISVFHVADNGMMTTVLDASYQNSNKVVTFSANHFSFYAVTEDNSLFTDVSTNDWYYSAVVWAVDNGISQGTSATTFSPNDDSVRAEALTLIWNAMGKPVLDVYIPFVDVATYDYFYESVRWAYGKGITGGISATEFSPYLQCNRAQIVTFLWVANGSPVVDEELYFSDIPVGSWYEAPVRWAVAEGITSGTTPNTFSPTEMCSRAEIVAFLYNCFAF